MTTLASVPHPSTPPGAWWSARGRRAGIYVLALLWGMPLIGFSIAYALAEETGSDSTGRSLVAVIGIVTAVLLIPLGLLALVLASFLAATWRRARPTALAAVSTGAALTVGLIVIGIMSWVNG